MKNNKFFDFLVFISYGLLQLFADGYKIVGAIVFLAGLAFLFAGFWFWIFPWESVIFIIVGAGIVLGGNFLKKWATKPRLTPKDEEVKNDSAE